ncbi:MAG: dynamin family protein [Arenicella sp.]|nr:dynamin family protein [Arenicella sp.]
MTDNTLNQDISDYSDWRSKLSDNIQDLSRFLKTHNVTDLRTHHQFELILGSLADDSLSVAFVAEFSRGKSEMINSIFFGDYPERVLPSGAGRTTMCPTELMYDPNLPTSVRLLPIESRSDERALFQLKNDPEQWVEIPFDINKVNTITEAVSSLTESKLVNKERAKELNFDILEDDNSNVGLPLNKYDEVEIPNWRHAIINLPHPLLEKGLVILDTPGLNAIGAEPELTINQLATAHTVVFILANDTGVTVTDLALWEQHISSHDELDDAPSMESQSKLVALNKIDSLWDGIRSEQEIEQEIEKQVNDTSKILKLPSERIFPVSAQKALLGKLTNDEEMFDRSRMGALEHAIADRLVPQKKQIVIEKIETSLEGVIDSAGAILDNRLKDAEEHIAELRQLSSKNSDVIAHIMTKVKNEKSSLESDMQRYSALRAVYGKETAKLLRMLSSERLEKLIAVTKHNMARCATSVTLQKIISQYFKRLNLYLNQAIDQANEIAVLSESITRDFEQEHGIANFSVRRLRLDKYKQEIGRLETKYSHLRDVKTLFFREQMTITNRFLDSVVIASRRIFDRALHRASNWNNNLMVPMETYVREHHTQLRRRLESVKRIHKASETVDARLSELEIVQGQLQQQHKDFNALLEELDELLQGGRRSRRKHSSAADPETPPLEGGAEILYWDSNLKV